jgi:hypothetical protein
MGSILTPEIPATYGALDSDAFADGQPADAFVGREVARSHNRLVCRGHALLNDMFDTSGDPITETPEGSLSGYGVPFWFLAVPSPRTVLKKSRCNRMTVDIYSAMRTGEEMMLQIQTDALPFDPASPAATGTTRIVGTGGWQWTTISDIPLERGEIEHVSLWLRGVPTSTLMSTGGSHGTPNSGTITDLTPGLDGIRDQTFGAGVNWLQGLADDGHALLIENGGGASIAPARWITSSLADTLGVSPGFDNNALTRSYIGATYKIVELARWRIGAIFWDLDDATE